MSHSEIITAYVIEDEACLTLDELCAACAVEPRWVIHHVEEGLLPLLSGPVDNWRFSSACLTRTRRMRALERDFDAVPELAALMADLLEEVETLRARLRRHQQT